MTKRPHLIIPAAIVGIALIVVAGIYIADPASSLPSFLPGHEAGSNRHHIKHGIAAGILGVLAFAFAWFQTEVKPRV